MAKRTNNGNHGAKGRSGRRPKAFTILKQRIEQEKQDDAEFAFTLYASVMRDETQPMELRLDCGDWISNRVMGKPKEKQERTGEMVIKIVRDNSSVANFAPSANEGEIGGA